MIRRSVLFAAAALLPLSTTNAYEVKTHERLTLVAFERSVMADVTHGPLAALGIEDVADISRHSIPPPDSDPELTSVSGLVGLGAIYEDNPLWPLSQWRFLRHFFDAQQGGAGLPTQWSSREWLLEEQNISQQEFSLRDARQLYLDALTAPNKADRERGTVLLLQTMGRVVHHMQDMAQPAHVRGDIHPPVVDNDTYERYTETQFTGANARQLPAPRPCGEAPIDLHDFDEAGKFWVNGGKGIAEFTSNTFVSADTNFRLTLSGIAADPFHPSPAYPANAIYQDRTLAELGISHPIPWLPVRFLGLPIVDQLSGGGCFNPRASAISALSSDLQIPALPGFTLNKFNFEESYSILFPRAIAYSTALLDYFFRGRLDLDSYVATDTQVEIVVRNASAADFTLSGINGSEEFSVYYDSTSGERRPLQLTGGEIGAAVIEHDQTRTLSFPMPADLDKSRDRPFVLVFNGKIGKEPGVAALGMGPRPASFLVTPSYGVADGLAGPRIIAEGEDGAWHATDQAGAVAGNIDWRGHEPDDVLTWFGPRGRYFGDGIITPNIYKGGKVLCTAPGEVIGAAITKLGGQRYLIAAVAGSGDVTIYKRPYQPSYKKDGMYHPLNNPAGWQQIGTIQSWGMSPVFFNASGTEGQMMSGAYVRFKVSISASGVNVETLSNVGSIHRLYTTVTDRSGEADVTPGGGSSCHAAGYECVSERGTCTDPQGFTNTNVCLVAQAREDTSSGDVSTSELQRQNVEKTVVCADYIGDNEVLCTVEASEVGGAGTSSSIGHWQATQNHTTTATCAIQGSGPQEYTHSYDAVSDFDDTMVLRVGSRTIPLSGSVYHGLKHYNTRVQWQFGSSMPAPSVDFTREDHWTEYQTHLLYVDARNEIVVYEDLVRHEDTVGIGSAAASPPDFYWHQWSFDAPSQTTESSTSRMIVLADQEYVLSSYTIEQEPQSPVYLENTGFFSVGIDYCSDDPPVTSVDDRTEDWDVLDFYVNSIHQMIDEGDQSLSAASRGSFVASLPIWKRLADGTYEQNGEWNHLSNGDLSTLLPVAPTHARYAPTGIVR